MQTRDAVSQNVKKKMEHRGCDKINHAVFGMDVFFVHHLIHPYLALLAYIVVFESKTSPKTVFKPFPENLGTPSDIIMNIYFIGPISVRIHLNVKWFSPTLLRVRKRHISEV